MSESKNEVIKFDVVVVGSCMTDLVRYVLSVISTGLVMKQACSLFVNISFVKVMSAVYQTQARPYMATSFPRGLVEKVQINVSWLLG